MSTPSTESSAMSDEVFVCDLDSCPVCGAQWAYEVDGKRYSYLGGIYSREQDRTIAWLCPKCDTQWKRNATVAAGAAGRATADEGTQR